MTRRDDGAGWAPIDVPMGLTPSLLSRITWGFVWLGVLLRVVRYLLDHPIWCDEAFLAVNFMDRGYLDLLRPLDYAQVSPLLFLWIERTAVKLFGFSEWSLRLVPTLGSIAGLFLFRHVAGRVLGEMPRMMAVAILAVAMEPIQLGDEIKPYATDLLVALGLLWPAIEWLRDRDAIRWLWALALFVPIALGLSHPAVFVAGGIGLGLAPAIGRSRRWGVWMPFAAFNFALAGTFLALFAVFTGEQSRAVLDGMRDYWVAAFPPIRTPGKLVVWLIRTHTGHMFSYPVGAANGGSVLTTLGFVVGAVALWKRGRGPLVAIFLWPFGLAFAAAVMRRYPYGGSLRTMMFVAPAICMLTGLGVAILVSRLPRPDLRRKASWLGVAALALFGLVSLGVDLALPYKFAYDVEARRFARWFWTEKARDAELVCVKNDMGFVYIPGQWQLGRTSVYLCLQKIYSERHRRNISPRWDHISATHPLRCVLYNEPSPDRNPHFASWLADMKSRYDLRNREKYIVGPDYPPHGDWYPDCYVVYEFVPRDGTPSARIAHSDSR